MKIRIKILFQKVKKNLIKIVNANDYKVIIEITLKIIFIWVC